MTESTHRLTLQLHVDDIELDSQRAIYVNENPDDENLDGFYGTPEEWSSILDVIDAQAAGVILRSEITDREHGVKPFDPYRRPSWAARILGRVRR